MSIAQLQNTNIDINTSGSISCSAFAADNLSCNELTITSDQGIVSLGDLNLNAGGGSIINLMDETHTPQLVINSTNGIIADTTDLNLSSSSGSVNISSPVIFQNPYTSISITSTLTGYSSGTFTLNFSGNCVNALNGVIIKYVRIGSFVTLGFPNLIFIKNNGPSSQITSTSIPIDLRPVTSTYLMQLTSLQDQPLVTLSFGIVEYDSLITGIRLTKNDNFTGFAQAPGPNNVQLSACSLSYII